MDSEREAFHSEKEWKAIFMRDSYFTWFQEK